MTRGRPNPLQHGLPSRLKAARKSTERTRKQLADEAGVAHSMIAAIEEEGRVPRLDTVARIAEALQIAPGFLAYGIECEPGGGCTGVGARILLVREEQGLSRKALARMAQTTDTTVRLTEAGETMPTIATAEQLADALSVSPAWLAYGEGLRVVQRRRARAQLLVGANIGTSSRRPRER